MRFQNVLIVAISIFASTMSFAQSSDLPACKKSAVVVPDALWGQYTLLHQSVYDLSVNKYGTVTLGANGLQDSGSFAYLFDDSESYKKEFGKKGFCLKQEVTKDNNGSIIYKATFKYHRHWYGANDTYSFNIKYNAEKKIYETRDNVLLRGGAFWIPGVPGAGDTSYYVPTSRVISGM